MPTKDQRAAVFERARGDLRTLLTASNISQTELADQLGFNQSNLSARLRRDKTEIFEIIAERFPPACWVAARLYSALAKLHLETWEMLAQRPEIEVREAVEVMERDIRRLRGE